VGGESFSFGRGMGKTIGASRVPGGCSTFIGGVACCVVFLIKEDSPFREGKSFNVDGGRPLLWRWSGQGEKGDDPTQASGCHDRGRNTPFLIDV